jgi:hypothetical protein
MAGDWIKMRTDLVTHPKVVRIASALNADKRPQGVPVVSDKFRVIGGLLAVWSVFDAHSVDGTLDGYTPEVLDDAIGFPGFTNALASVQWIAVTSQGLVLPRFEDHNGQSAKRRAQDADRKRESRKASASNADKLRTESGLEKRREEKKTNTPVGVFAVSSTTTPGRFPMPSNWRPSEGSVALIKRRCVGITGLEHDFVDDAIPEFILYWRGRPEVAMDAGKWDTTFLKHVVGQWERFRAACNNPNSVPRPLARDFFPSDQTINDLAVAGMSRESMLASLDRFKRYHLEKQECSCAWEYRFHQWALDDHVRMIPQGMAIEQKLNDRSWADA